MITCSPPGLSCNDWPVVVGGPGGQPVHLLETALFAPHVVDLHGCFPLRYQIQVLLGQVGSQLPNLELEQRKDESYKNTEKLIFYSLKPCLLFSNLVDTLSVTLMKSK